MDKKKTTLDDNAAIYNREPEKSDRQKWKEMNAAQRRSFFMAYYFKPLLFGLLGVLFVAYIIYSIVKPKAEILVNVAVSDYVLTDFSQVKTDYIEHLGVDTKEATISIDNSYALDTDTGSAQRFTVYAYAGDLDVLIAGKAVFEYYTEMGYLQPLDKIISAETMAKMEEMGVTFVGKIIERDVNGNVESVGEECIYGFCINNLSFIKDYCVEGNPAIIGVITGSKQTKNVEEFINFLFDNYK